MRLTPRALLHRMTFRTRLALAFSGLFLITGILLLAFVVVLARYGTAQQVQGISVTYGDLPAGQADPFESARPTRPDLTRDPPSDVAMIQKIDQTVRAVQDTALRQMVLWSAVGLLVLALLAGLLGWWLAGRALHPVASMTDTVRRISEQNLHQRLALTGPDDELHRLADTFDTMLDRLERSFESQRRFVANASHELKTPLAVQRTTLQVGLADPLPDGLSEVREDLLGANREAEQLINALLLLARSDRGLEKTEPVDLVAATRLVAAELAPLAAEAGLRLDIDTGTGTATGTATSTHAGTDAGVPPTVPGDPVLLRHLLTNLIRNAIQYNHPGGHVLVRLDASTVTVTNTGARVPADRIPDLFEPFRRLDGDRTATTGHGLGLSIAASIAQAHHATLTARPGPEGGLALTLRFS
ncbi:HAMP domain-containing sensor histidine kinase [Streptomyces sp. NBC_00347]|uniref:sensor histidine kinase n=1 Tax=Streptomyces sp. NBC_00347 TaxID=2975721 RepID=UPI002256B21B|nr:HAMP domain-containing sensor histidine kinase [Streptomyces sp. NBC_00347]MCX5129840.1 HAMP domain-containing histidine kinase [Streptomyces sp. NBC_00347]